MKFRKILFYYSILLSTLLFLWIIFYTPKPQSFIPLILFFPIPLYFWLHVNKSFKKFLSDEASQTHQEGAPRKKRSVMIAGLILAVLFISSMSIFLYSLMYEVYSPINKTFSKSSAELTDANKSLGEMNSRIGDLEATSDDILRQLSRISSSAQPQEKNQLGASDTALSSKSASTSGLVKINLTSDTNVYDDRNPTSKIVGKAKAGEIYTFTQRVGVWYLISLLDFKEGWVSSEFLKEL